MTNIHNLIQRLQEIEKLYPDIDVTVFALTDNGQVRQDTDVVLYSGKTMGVVDTLSIAIDHAEYEQVLEHWEPWMDGHRLTRSTRISPEEGEE